MIKSQRSNHSVNNVLCIHVSQDLRFVSDIECFDPNRDEMNIEEISIFESLPLEDCWEL